VTFTSAPATRASSALLTPIAASGLYAGLGVMGAELFLLGLKQFGQFDPLRTTIELSLFLLICAIALEPAIVLLGIKIDYSARHPVHSGFAFGAVGAALAVIFIGFNLTVSGAFNRNGASVWLYLVVHILMPLMSPGIVTIAWIVGSRRRYRSSIYGALAGFFSDALTRLILSSATGSVFADYSVPAQAISGGVQAAFYGGIGGLILETARPQGLLQNLMRGWCGAVGLWTLGYWMIGRSLGLPYADLQNQLRFLIVRLVDCGGWICGLALYPGFRSSFRRANALPAKHGIVLLRAVLFAPAVITFDLLLLVVGLHKASIHSPREFWGLMLGIASGLAWQLSTVTTINDDVWGRVLNNGAGLCAISSAAFLASTM